jgi:hypothetical protein
VIALRLSGAWSVHLAKKETFKPIDELAGRLILLPSSFSRQGISWAQGVRGSAWGLAGLFSSFNQGFKIQVLCTLEPT